MQSEEGFSSRVGAKIEELDAMIVQLQKRRQELVEAMNAEATLGRTPSRSDTRGAEETEVVDAQVLKALNSVSWKGFGQGKEGEWAFVMDRQGNLTKELQPAKAFIDALKTGAQVTAGKHRYKVSQDGKFLNRFELKKGQPGG